MDDLLAKVRQAGVVGAGGAGFPTNVKLNCNAQYIIANGAECEPLLRVDQQVMAIHAAEVVKGVKLAMEVTGAKQGVICLKAHYKDAKAALEKELDTKNIRIHAMKSYYPAGDEQAMVYEVTGRVVPTGGLPLDVGAVVCNVSTLVNIARAAQDISVTHKYVTVGGEVPNPCTLCVPIGTPVNVLLKHAGFKMSDEYMLILGGPCMGALCEDVQTPITKTTGGVLVLKKTHPLVAKKTKTTNADVKLIKAVCCQCSMCTQMCPRNALGLNVTPHKAMRAIANEEGNLLGEINGIFSCCDCGVCTYYACNFGLKPSQVMTQLKNSLMKSGVKPKKEVYTEADEGQALKKVPVSRLINRLGVKDYDVPAPMVQGVINVKSVKIPLKMHIGAPSVALVKKGDTVSEGQLIASIPENALGANVHASVSGTVSRITKDYIAISAKGESR